MPKILTVGTEIFNFPIEGENSGYAEEVTDWAVAVSDALSTVQAPNDLLTQSATLLNNQTTFADISGFIFNSAEVISINAEFIIIRTTASPLNNLVESGFIQGNFNGSSWSYSVGPCVGNAGIEFDITSAGQLKYKSTDVIGTSYSGTITFKGKVFNS